MRVKPSKEPYKFVCVFRGKQVVEEREYSSQHTPARHPPEPSTPPRQDRDDESPGTIRRGYYSETILVEEQDTGEPLGIEETEEMKNPFLDDEEELDSNNKEQEELDRIRRYLDARDKLGYVIRGNKFPIPPELYEDGSPTTTRGAAVLWPKARALTRQPSPPPPPPPPPSLEIIQKPQQQPALPPFDSGTPIFAPPPKITWRKIISTPGDDFDDPRAFYYPPFENNHYSFDGAGSSSYGSETKHSSAPVATVYKEHNSTVSKLSVQIQRPEKHALEDDDEGICDVHADEEQEQEILACNSFDGCWGLRKHIVSIYFWRAAERESFEERTDKLLILR
ncbi:hypothetical protein BGZ98_009229 [Dissophora globulifera]|nr:hypothetical protein BGZ98_009229 [Dissophora globulifera]